MLKNRNIIKKVIRKINHWKMLAYFKYEQTWYHIKCSYYICTYHLIIRPTLTILRKCKSTYQYLKLQKYVVLSFKSWCELKTSSYYLLNINTTVTVHPPNIVAPDFCDYKLTKVNANLPKVYLAKLQNVSVVEGSDLILADEKIALYDEIANDKERKYETRNNDFTRIKRKNYSGVGLKLKLNQSTQLPQSAIHFCKDYSGNYFHWMVEALPRLWIIEQFPELDSLPLLIDDNLKPQQLEVLQLLTQGKRELITLQAKQAYPINELIYPSSLSHVHNNYYHPIDYANDIVISPAAIHYLRDRLLTTSNRIANKKIYISRKNVAHNKRLLNDDEIEDFMNQQGFSIVYPEDMTFREQVDLFSQAKIIIGASGSALTNMIFSPPNAHVFVLSANNKQVNFNLFSTLANVSGVKLTYILGRDIIINHYAQTHNSFIVDTSTIESALERYYYLNSCCHASMTSSG